MTTLYSTINKLYKYRINSTSNCPISASLYRALYLRELNSNEHFILIYSEMRLASPIKQKKKVKKS